MPSLKERWALANKKKLWHDVRNVILILLGSAVLAFGGAVFLTPFEIVSGGAVTVGIIVSHFVGDSVLVSDIVVAAVQILFFVIGFIFLGKKFAARTLLATIAYPVFYSLFYRLGVGQAITESLASYLEGEELMVLFLAGLFGGFFTGFGVALTFLGNGSTGGFDILVLLISKYTGIKQGIASFLVDACTILAGLIALQDYPVVMIGIVSAVVAAMMIQFVYVEGNSCLVADIISVEHQKIADFIMDEMGHATTIMDVVGGYEGKKKTLVRVVIYRRERAELTDFISEVDPQAFVSFMSAKSINGEGFEPLRKPRSHKGGEGAKDGQED